MKWGVIRSHREGSIFMTEMRLCASPKRMDMKVRGHCLVWDHDNPAWLTQGHFTSRCSVHDLLLEHISTVMKHYAGKVFAWDVVNEALDENGG